MQIPDFQKPALKLMMGLLTLVVGFHLLIFLKIIPYTIVWAGKLQTDQEMYVFEIISMGINALLIGSLLIKGNYLNVSISEKVINGILWVYVLVFALNTIGNLLAKTMFEKVVFTPLTFLSAILIWLILRPEKNPKVPSNQSVGKSSLTRVA